MFKWIKIKWYNQIKDECKIKTLKMNAKLKLFFDDDLRSFEGGL